MNDSEQELIMDQSRKLYAEYEKWKETGHDISYRDWLEIVLTVERENHAWMIKQYMWLVSNLRSKIEAASE